MPSGSSVDGNRTPAKTAAPLQRDHSLLNAQDCTHNPELQAEKTREVISVVNEKRAQLKKGKLVAIAPSQKTRKNQITTPSSNLPTFTPRRLINLTSSLETILTGSKK